MLQCMLGVMNVFCIMKHVTIVVFHILNVHVCETINYIKHGLNRKLKITELKILLKNLDTAYEIQFFTNIIFAHVIVFISNV